MSTAIDVFREQREAADQVHARLTEISALLHQLRHQINALTLNDELRAVLRQEQSWLERAQLVLSQLRSFREQDALRFWPGVVRRWFVAFAFALASAAGRRRQLRMGDETVRRRARDTTKPNGIRGVR